MATIQLPPDFKEFLKLLTEHNVDYLLIGGYAVGYYGYIRATGDIDIWFKTSQGNAEKLVLVLKTFGFDVVKLSAELFLQPGKVIRMGMPPFRIELMSTISGVKFDDCYALSSSVFIDDISVKIISLESLKLNKKASGRYKDLDDLENLP
jgi:predicted nucleotidyltransferase